MPIEVECPKCGGVLRIEERLAGKQIECTECGSPMTVPELAAAPVEEETVAAAAAPHEVSFEDKMAIEAEKIKRQQQVPFAVRHTKAIFRAIGLVVLVVFLLSLPWLVRRLLVQGDISLLNSGTKEERQTAAKHLCEVANPTALNALIKYAQDEDNLVRRYCVAALGKLGRKEASPRLVEALSDGDRVVEREAAWALATCADENARGPLVAFVAANNPEDPAVIGARYALYRLGDEKQVDELVLALTNVEHATRTAASDALVGIGRKDLIAVIQEAMSRSPEAALPTMEKTIRELRKR